MACRTRVQRQNMAQQPLCDAPCTERVLFCRTREHNPISDSLIACLSIHKQPERKPTMPAVLQHIDQIAREKQRTVLYLMFTQEGVSPFDLDYENHAERQMVMQWLNEQGYAYWPCGHFADPCLMCGYLGYLYIDTPMDEALPAYRRLCEYLENADGTMRWPGVVFAYLPLEDAMENADMDEPGYWEKWAEKF